MRVFIVAPVFNEEERILGVLKRISNLKLDKKIIVVDDGSFDNSCKVVKNNFNGLLVSQNDIEETSQAILKVLNKPDLALRLGQNGRQQAQKMDWQNIVNQYIQVYKSF